MDGAGAGGFHGAYAENCAADSDLTEGFDPFPIDACDFALGQRTVAVDRFSIWMRLDRVGAASREVIFTRRRRDRGVRASLRLIQ